MNSKLLIRIGSISIAALVLSSIGSALHGNSKDSSGLITFSAAAGQQQESQQRPLIPASTHLITDYFQQTSNDIVLQSGNWTIDSLSKNYPLMIERSSGKSNTYLIQTSIIIERQASLKLTGINLLLRSGQSQSSGISMPVRIVVMGSAQVDNSTVSSWSGSNNSADPNPFHPRPFLLALNGGTLNVTRSQIDSMGFSLSPLSSLAALNYYNTKNFVIENSTLHSDYFGYYSQNASNFQIRNNAIYENTGYGLDPHSNSDHFVITGNHVYSNGKQGIICSFQCSNLTIAYNLVENNTEGIGIHWHSQIGTIKNNVVRLNDNYGIFISNQSSRNIIANNTVIANGYGIGILLNSSQNQVISNSIINDQQNQLFVDQSSAGNNNSLKNNKVTNDASQPSPPKVIQPNTSFKATNFTDPADALQIQYPIDWRKVDHGSPGNNANNNNSQTVLALTAGDGISFSPASNFTVLSIPVSSKIALDDLAEYAVMLSEGRLGNIRVLQATPAVVDSRDEISLKLIGNNSAGLQIEDHYDCIIDGDRAIFFILSSTLQNLGAILPLEEGIVSTANLHWQQQATPGKEPVQVSAPSEQPGVNHSYLYGCAQYTTNVNHCDILLNRFNSTQEDVVKDKLMMVPAHPNFVQSKYKTALKINADSLDLVRIENKGIYNSSKFTIYLSVSAINTENITGSLVSFVPEASNAGWDLEALPSNSADQAKIKFSLYNTQGERQSPGDITVPSLQFVDIVASFDGSTIKVYADGALKAQSKFNGTFVPSPAATTSLTLGSAAWCSCFTTTAAYDEFRYYNRALSDQEVSQLNTPQDSASNVQNPFILGGLFQSKTPAVGLAGQWRFDGDLSDASSNHNDAKYWTLAPNMVTTPDGRILFTVKNTGDIDTIDSGGNLLPRPFATISPIFVGWEQGLLGMTLDDKFSANHYVYVSYTYQDTNSGNIYARVIRLTDSNGQGTDMKIIYDRIPASHGFHIGGALSFNPVDDKLYVFVGDGTQSEKAQDLTTLNGKLLRLNRDGSIPSDNPFPSSPIFSYGHRNSFGLAFDPKGNGILAEAGSDLYDYVDYLQRGGNYGWPTMKQPNLPPEVNTNSSFIKPIRSYYIPPTPTQTIFYTGDKFPELKDSFIFGSVRGELYSLKVDNSTHALVSEIRLVTHLYPYEPMVAITQLSSGDILFAGYNIYKLQEVDSSHAKPFTNIVQINATNVDVASLQYNDALKKITVNIGTANGNNALTIDIPSSMLSGKISQIKYSSNSTIANDGKTAVTLPYSIQTKQTGSSGQVVMVQFPNPYSESDKMQITIDASGTTITKTVPEFSGLLLSTIAVIGVLFAIFFARANGLKSARRFYHS